jgi:TolB-like protein/class 3 adenylate cyclase
MFTDIAGYSALTQQNEARTLELLQEHRQLLRPLFPRYGGREVETAGDSFFVEFASTLDAAHCAVALQQLLFARNAKEPSERQIWMRIGLHVGDVVQMGENVHGDGVNIAARILPLAAPGGICLSEDVARQIQNKLDLPLLKLGRGELKHIHLAMDVYRIVLPWEKKRLAFIERWAFAPQRKRTRRVLSGAGALVLVVLFIWVGLSRWQRVAEQHRDAGMGGTAGTTQSAATSASPEPLVLDKRRIVVLPFVNLSADAENEYFSDGMTEELISRLSKIRGLEVIARTSAMKYKGVAKDVAEIGRELQIGTVLEGSVRKAEHQVRVTVQLINVHNQMHLWSQDYDRELTGVFAIQSDIAQRVTAALQGQLLTAEQQQLAKQGTENLEAYNLDLKGHYYFNKQTKAGLQKATEYFEQAIAQDPAYAQAYAELARTYAFLGWWGYSPPKEVLPKARALAEKAVAMDTQLGDAYLALALVILHDWDWGGRRTTFSAPLRSTRALCLLITVIRII